MNVRWREHEMTLVTIIASIVLASYLWAMHNTAPEQFASPFINNHVPFNLYRNVLLPDIGMGLLIYLSYVFMNIFTIQRLLFPKKIEAGTLKILLSFKKILLHGIAHKVIKKFAWLVIQILLITFFLGTALNVATYYKHEWQFHYAGFSIFFNKNNPNSQMAIGAGYAIVLFIIALYGVYICLRELIIHFIETSGNRRAYRTLICNKVTLFAVIYFSVFSFLSSFNLVHEYHFAATYFSLITPIFLLYMSNTYWLFPLKEEISFFNSHIIIRLLVSAFIYTLPFAFFLADKGQPPLFFISYWLVQLVIVTPVTWLLYQQRKDKILQLRGVEKALVKSKADLQFLRSQINPHFLFNVLNTLYGTALQENAERTAGGIQKLGDMMRFMLHENNLDFIQMSKEVEYLKNYIALQKLRTQSSPEIIIEDNISSQNCNHKIAPMLLIPLVENAFKHGISLKEQSWIKIKLECDEKNILFEVRNSMHPPIEGDPETERSGIGFKNVLERLKLIYPGKHQISVNGDGKEFFVQLAIQPQN